MEDKKTHYKLWLFTHFNFTSTFHNIVTYTWTEGDPLKVCDNCLSFIIKLLYWALQIVLSRFKLFKISEADFAFIVKRKRGERILLSWAHVNKIFPLL
jgi:hypothetical protein